MYERIAKAIEHSKLPFKRVGQKIKPKPVSYETVRCWTTGEHSPKTLDRFFQLADITGVRRAWLILELGPMLEEDIAILSPEEVAASLRAMPPNERASVIADAIGGAGPN